MTTRCSSVFLASRHGWAGWARFCLGCQLSKFTRIHGLDFLVSVGGNGLGNVQEPALAPLSTVRAPQHRTVLRSFSNSSIPQWRSFLVFFFFLVFFLLLICRVKTLAITGHISLCGPCCQPRRDERLSVLRKFSLGPDKCSNTPTLQRWWRSHSLTWEVGVNRTGTLLYWCVFSTHTPPKEMDDLTG